jgi:hypothetical protein
LVRIDVVGDPEGTGLVLPDLLNRVLAANDRLKYYLTLLQAAKAQAQQPTAGVDLRVEREAAGIANAAFDEVVIGSSPEKNGSRCRSMVS